MRRIVTTCLTLVAAALLVLPAAAVAAPKKDPAPQITRVQPMRISVGGLLTIRGRHFKAARTKNTIIFRSRDGRTAFVKPRRATSRKLVLRIPASVARLLKVSNSRQQPTRLKLRVLAGKFSKYTPKRLSPVVTGAGSGDGPGGGGDGGGGGGLVVCDSDADHDNDLLSNSLELSIGTDPCLADTDNDQMTDGWEYWSAKDLNLKAVPYPGKRPFPNALDPSDGAPAGTGSSPYDFDGDGLTTLEEYRAWIITGSSYEPGRVAVGLESALGYSDGTKYSRASDVPPVPGWRSASFGLANPSQPFPATYDSHGDPAVYQDDERDADADGLSNWLESVRGPGHYTWWAGFWKQEALQIEAWKKKSYCGQRPGDFDQRPFADVDLADPDVDGDTLLDGEDDQDNDDYSNIAEMYEVVRDVDGNGQPAWCGGSKPPGLVPTVDRGGEAWAVNAFNPCAPDPGSRSCPSYVPFE
jgi:IPT/TIG domain-containing protein